MKILVLSDSHSALSFMRLCIDAIKPDGIVHLGDYLDDGEIIKKEYPNVSFHQVPGNCDKYRCPPWVSEILVLPVMGVRLYMTHGHKHGVKRDIAKLLSDARACQVDAVLYGHTHIANCYQEPDGLWVLNPGSCGYFGGSVGLIEIKNNKIAACRILRQDDLEAFT